ncbi:MAG: EAL domain-containing protein [Lachnospiraceae bacterium]|nr:EAL domain-containing protein [Lachnospiraceae bacterium]
MVMKDPKKATFHADQLPGGFMIYRAEGDQEILQINQGLLEIFECSTYEEFQEWTSGSFHGFVYHEDLDRVSALIRRQIAHQETAFLHATFRIKTKKWHLKHVEAFGQLHYDSMHGDVIRFFLADTSQVMMADDIDFLTELPGSRHFVSASTRILTDNVEHDRKQTYHLLYYNIRNFHLLNLHTGLHMGDEFLRHFSDLLRYTFPGDLIGRLSDDRFAVLTTNSSYLDPLTQLRELVLKERPDPNIDIAVGICDVPIMTTDLSDALRHANLACSIVTNDHSFTFYMVYSQELERQYAIESFAASHIHEAIRNGHIKVFYQPIQRTINGEICSLEALARWEDPELGMIDPPSFIPILEETRQIYDLDCHIVRLICQKYRQNTKDGVPNLPVSFNLSYADFQTCDIFQAIEQILEEYQVPRNMLHVEITERILAEDSSRIRACIDQFHDAGYIVWMDHFGSGFSSLNVLKNYRFDLIKIDMLFLRNFTQKSATILSSIVSMAKKLGIQTLAEGVETEGEAQFLKEIGCEKIQGFFIAHPGKYEDVLETCMQKNLTLEQRDKTPFYDNISSVDLITDLPLALILDDGTHFKILWCNSEYTDTLCTMGFETRAEVETHFNDLTTPLYNAMRGFVQVPIASGKWESVDFMNHNNYLRFSIRTVANYNELYVHAASIINISKDMHLDDIVTIN